MRAHRLCTLVATWIAAALLVAATAPAGQAQQPADIAVIVHADVAIDNLTLAELRRVWLGDREFWPSGERITLFIRAPVAAERDAVVSTLCRMTEAQFRQHWIAKVFRNESPSGPKIVYSTESAHDQVARVPGAIAFVPASAVGTGVKVVRVDGRRPGETGYPIR
ncbi:MAG TPA: hypothetical protein VMM93_12875 [Vicinamibacterales bacterium]|nr:hypothetical protein [Vicinamibacterales bacterium]